MRKKKTTLFLIFIPIIVSTLYRPTVSAQDYRQWHLPEGAKFRLGKGRIHIIDSGGQYGVQFSPDGTRLAVATAIGIWLYETQTYQEVDLFTGPNSWIHNVSFSPDGRTLAGGSLDKVDLWDVSTGTHRKTLIDSSGSYVSMSFSPDGRTLATDGRGEIRLWDVSTGTFRQALENDLPAYWYNSVAFSPDGRTIAAGASGEIDLWDISTSTHREIPISGEIQSLSFSPDGQTLASSHNGGLHLWDVSTGTLRKTITFHGVVTAGVTFSPDGRTLVSGSSEGVHLWNVSTGMLRQTITSHGMVIAGVTFSPDGRTLVSGSSEGVHLWDVSTGMLRKTIKGHHNTEVSNLSFSPDGQILASGYGRDIRLWDVSTGMLRKTIKGHHNTEVSNLSFSPDGRTLATGGTDGIRLWDVSIGTLRKILDEHSEGVSSVAFSPDGRTLASSSGEDIHLWNVSTGTLRKTINGWGFSSVAFSPDGRMLATGGAGIDLWNLSAIENLDANSIDLRWDVPIPIRQSFLGFPYYIHSIAFSPDGRMLAAGGYTSFGDEGLIGNGNDEYSKNDEGCESIDDPWVNGIIGLWDVSTGTLRELSPGYILNTAPSVSFSPNGRMLASGSDGIHLWDTSISRHRKTLNTSANSVAFSPDGRMLASGDRDGTILLWDLALIVGDLVELPPLTLEALTIPPETTLLQNYPNPFNPETWIPYQLAEFTHVSLHIYTANGTLIRTLFSCVEHEAGTYRSPDRAAYWDGKNDVGEPVANGIYFYTLTAGESTSTRKMLIRK